MRRQLVAILTALIALLSWPVAATPSVSDDAPSAGAPVAVQRAPEIELRDEAAMVLIGTALIGLAAAVRRSA
jgi:hypothetical protein